MSKTKRTFPVEGMVVEIERAEARATPEFPEPSVTYTRRMEGGNTYTKEGLVIEAIKTLAVVLDNQHDFSDRLCDARSYGIGEDGEWDVPLDAWRNTPHTEAGTLLFVTQLSPPTDNHPQRIAVCAWTVGMESPDMWDTKTLEWIELGRNDLPWAPMEKAVRGPVAQ